MQIMFINNDGGGFASWIEIAEGTSIAALFAEKVPDRSINDCMIRVNREAVAVDYILQDRDQVSITPNKIQGAAGDTISIMFINNDGGGFASWIDVPAGTSIAALFAEKVPDRSINDCMIRVNREAVAVDYILEDRDQVSITPNKIQGAV